MRLSRLSFSVAWPIITASFLFGQAQPTCPIAATSISPHVYTFRNVITAGPDKGGWTPFNVMAVDLTVKNISNQDVAVIWFDFVRPDGITLASWDGVHRLIRVGQDAKIYFDNDGHFINVSPNDAVQVHLTKVRYANGMIVNFYPCNLGTSAPSSPFRPARALPGSPILSVGNGVSPPRVLESQLPPTNSNVRSKTPLFGWHRPSDSSKTVTFSVVIGEDGEPRDITIKEGTLGGTLDEEARQTLSKWYFAPATKDDKPVAVRIDISFTATHTAEGGFGLGASWPYGQDN